MEKRQPRLTKTQEIAVSLLFLGAVIGVIVIATWQNAEPIESVGFLANIPSVTRGPTITPNVPSPTPAPLRNVTPNYRQTESPDPTRVAPPVPTNTPMPTVPLTPRPGNWAENLVIGAPVPWNDDVYVHSGHIGWSPDGRQMVVSLGTGEWPRDQAGRPFDEKTVLTTFDKSSHVRTVIAGGDNPFWSPDGRWIVSFYRPDNTPIVYLRAVDIKTREAIDAAAFGSGDGSTIPAWLSSRELVFYKGKPAVFDLQTRQSRDLLDAALSAQLNPDFRLNYFTSIPAKGIFAAGSGAEILLMCWTNGAAQLIRRIGEGLDSYHWELSPDGQWLAYVSGRTRSVMIVSVADASKSVETRSGGRGSPLVNGWSPDSTSLFYTDSEGTKIINRDGSGLRLIATGLVDISWAPQGDQIIAVGRSDTRLYQLPFSKKR